MVGGLGDRKDEATRAEKKMMTAAQAELKKSSDTGSWDTSCLEDVKKSIWPKSKLMQNVCRRPSDHLLGILARLFLEPKFPHTNFSISSHLPDEITPIEKAHRNP